MIRLPPTSITLGRSDLLEFDKRRQKRFLSKPTIEKDFARICITTRRYSDRDSASPEQLSPLHSFTEDHDPKVVVSSRSTIADGSLPPSLQASRCYDESLPSYSNSSQKNALGPIGSDDDEQEQVSTEQGGPFKKTSQSDFVSSSPAKDDFHYGGFIESHNQESPSEKSSPFVPSDLSTPKDGLLPGPWNPRTRLPLPRSPLFLSQNASSSPEHRPTSGLTPRVRSRVATHNTPGIMFALPARRAPRQSPRRMRHQSNSFSFDSSERASAAYEQERTSSASTNNSRLLQCEDMSLHEELRDSSLQSSRVASGIAGFMQLDHDVERYDIGSHLEKECAKERTLPSPRLPLPPPFSTVSRNVSAAGSLPSSPAGSSTPFNPRAATFHPQASPTKRSESYVAPPSPGSSPPSTGQSSSRSRTSSGDTIHSMKSVEDEETKHSPLNTTVANPRMTRSGSSKDTPSRDPQTPSRSYAVYNDTLSPSTQPQTPDHLPESQHRSRYHPSYTAPASRSSTRPGNGNYNVSEGTGNRTPSTPLPPLITPVRTGRPAVPLGLADRGFQGLYGGRENGDDEREWFQGVSSSSAVARLWGSRDARNDDRNLRVTPEPEDVRVGRRS